MAQIKLTKNEQKKQKDALKRFRRYLPTLILKKQQLQMVLRQIEQKKRDVEEEKSRAYQSLANWLRVYGEPIDVTEFIKIRTIRTSTGNIAGIDIPVFEELTYEKVEYDVFALPLWVDSGIEAMKKILRFDAELLILDKQYAIVSQELRTTSQRVNLFEKVKIPEARENIRRIQIYLGDQQTASVVRGKISKGKIAAGGIS